MESYLNGMSRIFDFRGRSTRKQFWLFELVTFAIFAVGIVLDTIVISERSPLAGMFTGLVMLAHIIPQISVTVRRLHDAGNTGWWVLVGVVPFGALILLVLACLGSERRPNKYGPPVGLNLNTAPAVIMQGYAVPPPIVVAPAFGGQVEQLERLANLRASGAIDDAEFARMKASVLQAGA